MPLDSRNAQTRGEVAWFKHGDYLPHFISMTASNLREQFSVYDNFYLSHKANTPAFHQMYLRHKN